MLITVVVLILFVAKVEAFIKPTLLPQAYTGRGRATPRAYRRALTTSNLRSSNSNGDGKGKKLADQIQEAGGFRNFLVDELTKDRTEEGDSPQKDPTGLDKPVALSPAAKERLRKAEELNGTVIKATRAAGALIVGSCVALLYLASLNGLVD
jgi:hypothetical protein